MLWYSPNVFFPLFQRNIFKSHFHFFFFFYEKFPCLCLRLRRTSRMWCVSKCLIWNEKLIRPMKLSFAVCWCNVFTVYWCNDEKAFSNVIVFSEPIFWVNLKFLGISWNGDLPRKFYSTSHASKSLKWKERLLFGFCVIFNTSRFVLRNIFLKVFVYKGANLYRPTI